MNKPNPMLLLAERYSDELTAQFRTLNFFAEHAGEIGRAHETYLRGMIGRFLPAKCSIGTGFIVSNKWSSTQQDIIIYNQQDFPVLLKVGDCVVVDTDAVAAVLEVKTRLKSKKDFLDAYKKSADFYKQIRSSRFVGLFIWDGPSVNLALSTIWDYVREDPLQNLHYLPNAIYIRSKFLLILNQDGRRETPPFRIFKISKKGISEGQALLTLMTEIWMGGVQGIAKWPWWLEDWWRKVPEFEELVPWPSDLQQVINDSLSQ
ncbi:hypothetical protein ANAEL_05674 [Anaerolineales bacterium]|nr:hypothetical protein ANAEL_05674 [Anaerolineales bacterium]